MSNTDMVETNIGPTTANDVKISESTLEVIDSLPDTKNTPQSSKKTSTVSKSWKFWVTIIVIFLVGAICAVVLSWRCNSALQYGTGAKIIFAIGAFLMNYAYLYYY